MKGRRAKKIDSGADWYFPKKHLLWRTAGQQKIDSGPDWYFPTMGPLWTAAGQNQAAAGQKKTEPGQKKTDTGKEKIEISTPGKKKQTPGKKKQLLLLWPSPFWRPPPGPFLRPGLRHQILRGGGVHRLNMLVFLAFDSEGECFAPINDWVGV